MSFISASASVADGPFVTKAEGVVEFQTDALKARKAALDNALKNAISLAIASIKGPEDPLPDLNPFDYILNFRILSEAVSYGAGPHPPLTDNKETTESMHVWVEATIDIERLKEAVKGPDIKGPSQALTMLTVTIVDVNDYSEFASIVSMLRKTGHVADVSYSSFFRGRITLSLKTTGTVEALVQDLAGALSGYEAAAVGQRSISIRPAKAEEGAE
jgi:hypothetical protein